MLVSVIKCGSKKISMNTCDYLYQEDQSLHKLLIPNDFTNNCIIYPENEYEKWGQL